MQSVKCGHGMQQQNINTTQLIFLSMDMFLLSVIWIANQVYMSKSFQATFSL